MTMFYKVCLILAIVGGVNWGLIGLFDFNLVSWLLGTGMAARVVYGLVGVCALLSVPILFKWNEPYRVD